MTNVQFGAEEFLNDAHSDMASTAQVHRQLASTALCSARKHTTTYAKTSQVSHKQLTNNFYRDLSNRDYHRVHKGANGRTIAGTDKSFQLTPE